MLGTQERHGILAKPFSGVEPLVVLLSPVIWVTVKLHVFILKADTDQLGNVQC